jgi:Ankyrin repeats (3 copies)
VTRALRYPVCSEQVLDGVLRHPECPSITGTTPELPKRLFRMLKPRIRSRLRVVAWSENDAPLPFLRYLYDHPRLLLVPPDADAHDGYALIKAVSAGFVPLVRFLLDHGASPHRRNYLAVMIAIHQKDLTMVRLLIERGYGEGTAKKPRLDDRVPSTLEMLKKAVACGAEDIVGYFLNEKAIVPDMHTIQLLTGRHR